MMNNQQNLGLYLLKTHLCIDSVDILELSWSFDAMMWLWLMCDVCVRLGCCYLPLYSHDIRLQLCDLSLQRCDFTLSALQHRSVLLNLWWYQLDLGRENEYAFSHFLSENHHISEERLPFEYSCRRSCHLVLVPSLGFLPAACGDLLILTLYLLHHLFHVQMPAVIHLNHQWGVFQLLLQLTQLLFKERERESEVYTHHALVIITEACSRTSAYNDLKKSMSCTTPESSSSKLSLLK